ncbi:MAG: DNA-deoxyinosine glycosylase [Candidatus Omnitrophica bacterium]|nr:DNA-deoxyinosine glycosylase [Candidatus Omnitrophota bacterium]
MFKVLRKKDPKEYKQRIKILEKNHIGLWDVIYSCTRKGSADTKIQKPKFNNITQLLKEYSGIKAIFLNGRKAEKFFVSKFQENNQNVHIEQLPSTGPANAGQTPAYKYLKWKRISEFLTRKTQGGVR